MEAHVGIEDGGEIDDIDFDIDFAINEPGRPMTLGKYGNVEETAFDETELNNTHNPPILKEGAVSTANTGLTENRQGNSIVDEGNVGSSLVPLPEQVLRQHSAPRAIPFATKSVPTNFPNHGSQPSSAGSTASAFLNNILNPASAFNNGPLSHTPPTSVSTSYETSHFGKRPRSGSISERLRVSTELEQKGMIDREQKGILKDLIISGQDNELQHALDMYEQGDITKLESMLQNGALSNTAMTDIDLLGDLDLDFLNVSGDQDGSGQRFADAAEQPAQPPPSLTTRGHSQLTSEEAESGEASDGIGDLDFDGGIDGAVGFAPIRSYDRAPSPAYHSYGPRSRSNSTFSVDGDFRHRSNSLFSALIGSAPHEAPPPADYGRWMERSSEQSFPTDGGSLEKDIRRSSAPNLQTVSTPKQPSIQPKRSNKAKPGVTKREIRAEEKRRERQQKKEKKAREKLEKKEKREQAKLEKQKKAEMEDKEEHQPGSGRPRSMSDPNLRSSVDVNGLLQVERPDGWIGAYSPESRKVRIDRFLEKRNHRVWTKTVKYDVRKNFADSRLRVKGRFVKKEDELLMRELMSLT
eukprot:scaffold5517_cov135-Cylindrotheca_fusiformis.AAC.39